MNHILGTTFCESIRQNLCSPKATDKVYYNIVRENQIVSFFEEKEISISKQFCVFIRATKMLRFIGCTVRTNGSRKRKEPGETTDPEIVAALSLGKDKKPPKTPVSKKEPETPKKKPLNVKTPATLSKKEPETPTKKKSTKSQKESETPGVSGQPGTPSKNKAKTKKEPESPTSKKESKTPKTSKKSSEKDTEEHQRRSPKKKIKIEPKD